MSRLPLRQLVDGDHCSQALLWHWEASPAQACPLPAAGPQHSDFAWDMHCAAAVAVAATVVMADIARQVEVGCAERGRALVQAWNLYAHATAAATGATPVAMLLGGKQLDT